MTQLLDREVYHRELGAQDASLTPCQRCGHSQRNHERGATVCARALCECDHYC
jgi:hypothetical protein